MMARSQHKVHVEDISNSITCRVPSEDAQFERSQGPSTICSGFRHRGAITRVVGMPFASHLWSRVPESSQLRYGLCVSSTTPTMGSRSTPPSLQRFPARGEHRSPKEQRLVNLYILLGARIALPAKKSACLMKGAVTCSHVRTDLPAAEPGSPVETPVSRAETRSAWISRL